MLDEFLGGAEAKRTGCPELRRKFVSARRDILITDVEGRDGAKLPAVREIRGTAAARGRKRAGSRRKQGVIRAYLRYE